MPEIVREPLARLTVGHCLIVIIFASSPRCNFRGPKLDGCARWRLLRFSSTDNPHGWISTMTEIQCEINRWLTENLRRMEHGDIMTLARIEMIDPVIRKKHYPKPKKRRR